MLATILGFLQIIKFFLDLWHEKDQTKSASKAAIGKEVVDAFAETDPNTRASKFIGALNSINQLRHK